MVSLTQNVEQYLKPRSVKEQKEIMSKDEMNKVGSDEKEKIRVGKAEEEQVVGKEDKVELHNVMEKEEIVVEEVTEQDVVDFDFLKLRICHKMHGGGKLVSAKISINLQVSARSSERFLAGCF